MLSKMIKEKCSVSLAGLAASFFLLGLLVALPAQALEIKEGEWQKAWNEAKKEFEEETGEKKPSKTFLKKIRVGSGLEKAAKEVDKAYVDLESNLSDMSDKAFVKKLNALEKAIDTFESKANKYMDELDKAGKKADKKKSGKYIYQEEINILSKHLTAVLASMEEGVNLLREKRGNYSSGRKGKDPIRLIQGSIEKAEATVSEVERFLKRKYSSMEFDKREEVMKKIVSALDKRANEVYQKIAKLYPKKLKEWDWDEWDGKPFESVLREMRGDFVAPPEKLEKKLIEFKELLEFTSRQVR